MAIGKILPSIRTAMFVAALSLPLWAQDWAEKRNQEIAGGKKIGWSFEVPRDWAPISGPAPYPICEGYTSADGKSTVQVLWLSPDRFSNEQEALQERGYASNTTRLGGFEATVWSRPGVPEKLYYVSSPQGNCRLRLVGTDTSLPHAADSFRFLATGGTEKTWVATPFSLNGASFQVDTPSSWKFASGAWKDGNVRLTVESVEGDPSRSLRGLARSSQPKTGKGWALKAFDPIETDAGADGYVAVWGGPDGILELAYFQLGKTILRFQLYKAERENGLRVVRTLRTGP